MKKLILITISILSSTFAFTQNYCGTVQTESDLVWLRDFQKNYIAGGSRADIYYVPLTIHIVGNDDGSGYIDAGTVMKDICNLNEQFAETGFYFYILDEIDYINETKYNVHDFEDGYDMMVYNNVANTVNVYFVADPAGNCGYFSPGGNAVAIANSCGGAGNSTIAHEFGHFFSLPHTFYGWEYGTPSLVDREKVSGANCGDAADGFCDTPPDYMADRWYCSSSPTFTDPDGVDFVPDGTLFMSYSDDGCQNRFSIEQIDAMVANLEGPRDNLLVHPAVEYVDVDSTELISPLEDEENIFSNDAHFAWNAVENAIGYVLQVSYTPAFSGTVTDIYTTETNYIETNLVAEHTYFWRVKVIAEANTCEGFSPVSTFKTGAQVLATTENINSVSEQIILYPNPVLSGDKITFFVPSLNNADAIISFMDITGNILLTLNSEIITGTQKFNIQLPQLPSGMYSVSLRNGDNVFTRSLIIME